MRPPLPLLALLCACTGPDDTADTGPAELTHRFSFVVVADPHVTGEGERADRLAAAVDWIEENADARQIELVFVVGDIGWSGGLPVAKSYLDELSMPYVPVIGDNEIQLGAEQAFDTVFAPRYADLSSRLDGWERGAVEVYDPDEDRTAWMQNWRFTYQGVQFAGLDWCARVIGGLIGEMADLHDFEDGTFPWFAEGLAQVPDEGESVVLLSHHPMHLSPGAFDGAELAEITALTSPLADRVAANYAGHYHLDSEAYLDDGGYDVIVTDATWDDLNRVRLVEVWGDGAHFDYVQEVVVVP